DNSQEIIQLLQNQNMQQAQIIATLQEQAQTFKNQAQIIAHLQSKVEQFEVFHNRMRNLYCEALPFDDSILSASSSNSSQNFYLILSMMINYLKTQKNCLQKQKP